MRMRFIALTVIVCFQTALHLGADVRTNISWSTPTNGLFTGLYVETNPQNPHGVFRIYVKSSSGLEKNLNRPDQEEMLTITLRDDSGQNVRKTVKGKRYGKQLDKRASFRNRSKSYIHGLSVPQQIAAFTLDELFIVPRAGTYTLEISPRLFVDTGAKYFSVLQLNPVVKTVTLNPANSKGER